MDGEFWGICSSEMAVGQGFMTISAMGSANGRDGFGGEVGLSCCGGGRGS
jgi:hypothetical protein